MLVVTKTRVSTLFSVTVGKIKETVSISQNENTTHNDS